MAELVRDIIRDLSGRFLELALKSDSHEFLRQLLVDRKCTYRHTTLLPSTADTTGLLPDATDAGILPDAYPNHSGMV